MIDTHIRILVKLAERDGRVDERERSLIRRIGLSNGLDENTLSELMSPKGKIIDYGHLTFDQGFDILVEIVQLMKVDGLVADEEINFALDVANKLGLPLEIILELYSLVHANMKLSSEINTLKHKYQKNG